MEFLDTNVLVYAASRKIDDRAKTAAARALICYHGQAISLQVLQEFYTVARNPRKLAFTHDEAVVFSWIVWPSKAVRDSAWEKVMADPRMDPAHAPMPFDGKRMVYGGFQIIMEK